MVTTATRASTEAPRSATRRTESDSRENSTERISTAIRELSRPERARPVPTSAGIALWTLTGAATWLIPDSPRNIVTGTRGLAVAALIVAVLVAVTWAISLGPRRWQAYVSGRLAYWSPWVIASAIILLAWELATAKLALVNPPYFPSPQKIISSVGRDRVLLAQSFGNSLTLLAVGYLVGALAGLGTGLAMGWSQQANYWVHPVLQYIGPVPTMAWVPIVFVAFPSSYSGAVFLIALSVWFPVTVLTRAGVAGVPRAYFDVARTLGARSRFLIWRVSLPAALPNIFTGLFMALSMAFVTLTVAENFGVNSGLGWYINWKKGWSDYPSMYGAIIVMVVFCGGLMSGLIKVRNRVLRWQKDLTRW